MKSLTRLQTTRRRLLDFYYRTYLWKASRDFERELHVRSVLILLMMWSVEQRMKRKNHSLPWTSAKKFSRFNGNSARTRVVQQTQKRQPKKFSTLWGRLVPAQQGGIILSVASFTNLRSPEGVVSTLKISAFGCAYLLPTSAISRFW